jgi:tetratricopeptide (TPR) repeat protein
MDQRASKDRAEAIRRLFDELVECAPEEQVERLAAIGDTALRQEVASLLDAYDRSGGTITTLNELRALLTHPASDDDPSANPGAAFDPFDPKDPLALVDKQVRRYAIEAYLGGGGMGIVYKARDTRLGRRVALKFLPPHLSAHPEAKERLLREARAASALDHPNIGTIHEIGETKMGIGGLSAGQRFIAMAYYPGETLKAKIARGPLPVDEAIGYAIQIADGLCRAHKAGIIHRDVKPANVMVTKAGQVKLVDFGLARAAGQSELTRSGQALGTVAYMSPEQAQGEAVDARTDIWSLGTVLYEMLTGRRPFRGRRPETIIYAILNEAPRPLSALRPEVTPVLAEVVERCLTKSPDERYTSAEAVLQVLHAAPETAPTRWTGRALRLVASYAAAALLTLGTAYGLTAWLGTGPFATLLAADALEEENRIVLADFATRTVDATLADAVTDAFRVDLSQSQTVMLASGTVVRATLERMERSPGASLDVETAREVAIREGLKAVVGGEINAVGTGFVLSARLVVAESGEELVSLRETAEDEDAVILAIGRLSTRLREQLGELLGSVQANPRLVRKRTASLEALMRYQAAIRANWFGYDFEQCVMLLTEAIAIDPLFAAAYKFRGACISNMGGSLTRTFADLRKAFELRDRMTDNTRAETMDVYYMFTGEYEKAIEVIEAHMDFQPELAKYFLNDLSLHYAALGQLAQSEAVIRQTLLHVDTPTGLYWSNLTPYQMAQGKLEEAEKTLREWEESGETTWGFLRARADLAFVRGQYETAETHVRAWRKQESGSLLHRAYTSTQLGRLAGIRGALTEAEAHFRDAMQASEERGDVYHYYLNAQSIAAMHLWLGGDSARAQETLNAARAKRPLRSAGRLDRAYHEFAIGYAQTGQPGLAQRFLETARDSIPRELRRRYEDHTHAAQGWIAFAKGHLKEAPIAFKRWTPRLPWGHADRHFALGLIYDRMAKPDSAIAHYERYLAKPHVNFKVWSHTTGWTHSEWWRAPVHERLGRLYEARGEAEQAVRHHTRFVELWKEADADLHEAGRGGAKGTAGNRIARGNTPGGRHRDMHAGKPPSQYTPDNSNWATGKRRRPLRLMRSI